MSCRNELLGLLSENLRQLDVVVMPDFFLDRLIALDCEPSSFFSMVENVAERKGGSIDGTSQTDMRGGNAVNTASALAALGTRVTPIVCTNKLGLQQMNFHLKPYHVDTSHVKILKRASLTTALEFRTGKGKANVMLRDLGSLADFGPEDLADEDHELIERADYVCLFNWAGTRNHGTRLAETVFQRAKAKGKGKTYYDTADPTPNREKMAELMRKVLAKRHVDVLSLNENEANSYVSLLNKESSMDKQKPRSEESAAESARVLAKRLSARIDLHTTSFSATFTKRREVTVPAFKVRALRATGAGDAWNAGNIIGDGNGFSNECRLALANAVSACYISDPEGAHPTRQKLARFIRNSG